MRTKNAARITRAESAHLAKVKRCACVLCHASALSEAHNAGPRGRTGGRMKSNLANSLGAGVLPADGVVPPAPKCRPGKVGAWPKVWAVLNQAPEPMLLREIMAATGLPEPNVSVALHTHREWIERTGDRKPFRYAVRRPA